MKKRMLSFLSLFLAVALVACGNPGASSDVTSLISEQSSITETVESEIESESSLPTQSDTAAVSSDTKTGSSGGGNYSKPEYTHSLSSSDKPFVTVNGISLSLYTVVYDMNDTYARFAAENLKMYVEQNFNHILPISPDITGESEYEIIIGDTKHGLKIENEGSLSGDRYALRAVGKKILLKADGYMLGGAVRGFLDICESAPKSDNTLKATISDKTVFKTYAYKSAENALLYIGDGMGQNHIKWALSEGMPRFFADDMPNKGETVTYSHSVTIGQASYTDSAAAGTALATGYKTLNGRLGLDKDGKAVKNIRELAASKGAKTAVLTTDAITGATPAAFLVHIKDRNQISEIQSEISNLGVKKAYTAAKGSLGDSLLSASSSALREISTGDSFFMMLEEGYIDKHSHSNDKSGMIKTVNRFNEAIAFAMEFTLVRGDTVLIVTADHETGGIKDENGFKFTSGNHTNSNVPLYAMGKGTEVLTSKPLNNVLIPRFIANLFGDKSFGDMTVTE